MKLKISMLISFVSIISLFNCKPQTSPKKVVIIGLDGLSVEGYLKAKHPNIDSLMAKGVLSLNTRCVMPSVTLPNWTSHLTSGGPEQHGVTSNAWRIDNQIFPPIETDTFGYYPSIFKVLKEQIPNIKTGYYYNWKSLINSINTAYIDDLSFEDNDKYKDNYEKAYQFIKQNELNPLLVFLYSVHVDHAGHAHHWMSPEYIKSIEEVDVEIGHFIDKLKTDNLYDNTHFLLITDHGGNRKSGHGGLTLEEMEVPWGITGPDILKNNRLNSPNSNANTAKIISHIFNIEKTPNSWIGSIPEGIFKSE